MVYMKNFLITLYALSTLGCLQQTVEIDGLSNAIEGPGAKVDTKLLFPAVGYLGNSWSDDPSAIVGTLKLL